LDHPSSSAIRRAALIICARRACLSRSFRSAIRSAARVVAIDRKYSAARINLQSNLSLLYFLIMRYFILNAIPLSLGTMNHWMWPVSLIGILSTAVVCGTDMFFLTVGRPALRLASSSAEPKLWVFSTRSARPGCRSGASRRSWPTSCWPS
jgi:hypothetical protein